MATRKKAAQKRTSRARGQVPAAVKRTATGLVVRPAPLAPPAPPAPMVWVAGVEHAGPLGSLARAVAEKRGRDALAAIGPARQALDKLTARAVQQARDQGLSWADVGAAFGITRQSAHERFARRPPGPAVQRCYFDGRRSTCSGVATTARAKVPLCEACEDSASSLKRLPRRRLRA